MMLSFLFFFISLAQAQTCAQDITRILSKDPVPEAYEKALKGAESAIGKPLKKEQSEALEQVLRKTAGDNYMASDILAQTKILAKAGFYPEDIALLRKRNILGNTVIQLPKTAPTGFKIEKLALQELDSKKLKEIKNGSQKYNYIVAENGEIHVTTEKLDFPKDKLIIAGNKTSVTGQPDIPLLVREAGELSFDKKAKGVVFKPTHSFESNELASKALTDKVKDLDPAIKAQVLQPSKAPASKVLKCLDIVSSQSNGKNFLLNRMIADNAVAVSAITTSEMMGAGRMNTEEGRKLLIGDLVGGNANTILGSVVGLKIVKKDLNWYQSLGARAGMGYSGVQVQKAFHQSMVSQESSEAVNAIANFNTAHFIARLPINHYFDKFVVNQLPNMIFNACQRNPALAVAISPVSIRMYERYASSVIYYGLREPLVGQ